MTEKELAEMLRRNPDLEMASNALSAAARFVRNEAAHITEYDLQAAVIAECDRRALGNPVWGYIYANVNGQYRPGQRMEPGLRPGVPDLFVPVARHGYYGAYVELKVGNNQPSPKQRVWIELLKGQGYIVKVFHDDPALVIDWLDWYLEVVK